MDTFEFDSDAFYICTEVSPRNFVVQKAIQIDKSQIERMVGKLDGKVEKTSESSPGPSPSSSSSNISVLPQPPPLPYWFNRECRSNLTVVGHPQSSRPPPPSHHHIQTIPSSSNHFNPAMPPPGPRILSHEEIKEQLKKQLEYYFSRENLQTDRYLKCQMDEEHYVPINVLVAFPKIAKLTDDVDLIVEVLKDSVTVELDPTCEKVRAATKRVNILIREYPENRRDAVDKLLEDAPAYSEMIYVDNDSWYVTYPDELQAQCAYVLIQNRKNEITERQVCARMRTGGPPTAPPPPLEVNNVDNNVSTSSNNGERGTFHMAEPGQTLGLGEIGLIPIATYRPGEPMTSHYQTRTCQFAVNNYAYSPAAAPIQSPPPPPPPLLQAYPHQGYYPSTATTTNNFDAMSTASSNSTHTSASNYNNGRNNRNGGGGAGSSYNNQPQYESRRSFSNSNDWRNRSNTGSSSVGGNRFQNQNDFGENRFQRNHNENGGNRFQNNHNDAGGSRFHRDKNDTGGSRFHESNGRQMNGGRGSWRGGPRNGSNGQTHQTYPRQNNYRDNWRNEQQNESSSHWNDSSSSSNQNRSEQYNQTTNYHNNGGHNRYHRAPVSSSSSSSASYLSLDTHEHLNNSATSPPLSSSDSQQQYTAPTPTDLPPPPVWPAPSFDKRRKSSEASSGTITNTVSSTLTPSTPKAFNDNVFDQETKKIQELNINEKPNEKKEQENGIKPSNHKIIPRITPKTVPVVVDKEKVKSPPVVPVKSPPVVTPTFAFEETAFPSLPKKVEPVKPPQKPTFR